MRGFQTIVPHAGQIVRSQLIAHDKKKVFFIRHNLLEFCLLVSSEGGVSREIRSGKEVGTHALPRFSRHSPSFV